jgi:N-formylglutamate deformylase
MILHIPHSSAVIPEDLRDQFVLSDGALAAELLLMTDAFTDELFASAEATTVRFPVSRLVLDVERFADDAREPMSSAGMGMIYNRTAAGKKLRRALQPQERRSLVSLYYETHQQALVRAVENELAEYGNALIVDCHSFPSQPLPCDKDKSFPRPQFCLGTHPFHTPKALAQSAELSLKGMGYHVRMNRPYPGTMVPPAFYKTDRRVASVMVEVNRRIYMNEKTGAKTRAFDPLKEQMQSLLSSIKEFQQEV